MTITIGPTLVFFAGVFVGIVGGALIGLVAAIAAIFALTLKP